MAYEKPVVVSGGQTNHTQALELDDTPEAGNNGDAASRVTADNPTGAQTTYDPKTKTTTFDNVNYTVTADPSREGRVTILNKKTGETTEVWGDPHVNEGKDKGRKSDWDFHGDTTFQLEDGTTVTLGTEKGKNEGTTYTDSMTVIVPGKDGGPAYGTQVTGLHTGRGEEGDPDPAVKVAGSPEELTAMTPKLDKNADGQADNVVKEVAGNQGDEGGYWAHLDDKDVTTDSIKAGEAAEVATYAFPTAGATKPAGTTPPAGTTTSTTPPAAVPDVLAPPAAVPDVLGTTGQNATAPTTLRPEVQAVITAGVPKVTAHATDTVAKTAADATPDQKRDAVLGSLTEEGKRVFIEECTRVALTAGDANSNSPAQKAAVDAFTAATLEALQKGTKPAATTPPAGTTTTPPAGTTTTPPAGGTTTPPAGGTTTPPVAGTTVPPAGSTTTPPVGGTTPSGGGTTTPVATTGTGQPAPGGGFPSVNTILAEIADFWFKQGVPGISINGSITTFDGQGNSQTQGVNTTFVFNPTTGQGFTQTTTLNQTNIFGIPLHPAGTTATA